MLGNIRFHDFKTQGIDFGSMALKVNQINIFIGKNGSGKTFLFKATWFMAFTLNLYKVHRMLNSTPGADDRFKKELDIVFDLTYTEADQISGAVSISDSEDEIYDYYVLVEDGKISHFNIDIKNMEKFTTNPIENIKYNTKEARTFNQYDSYIKIKKMMGITAYTTVEDFQKIGEMFRIYDVMWFEQMAARISGWEKGEEKEWLQKVVELSSDIEELPDLNNLVFRNSKIYIQEGPEIKSLAACSAGVQAMLMMILFSGS